MKNKSRNQQQSNNESVHLFPQRVRIAIICAFGAVILAILVTVGYTVNMIFNPAPTPTTQQK